MITVHFKDVGRDKRTWSAEFKSLDHKTMYREVKSKGGLMSSDIDFCLESGSVIVGGWRTVGKFTVSGLPLNHAFQGAPAHREEAS